MRLNFFTGFAKSKNYIEFNASEMAAKVQKYEKMSFLGEGQFALVYKARNLETDEIVAVKKIKIGSREEARDGINRTALREIKLLQELSHENVVGLLDVFGQKSNVSLVFEFVNTDLEVIIKDSKIVLTSANIKSYMIQTLKGLEYLHANWIMHRDLKPNNLLVNNEGVLKIGDFGLAKFYGSPTRINTHQVVTRWYRCPELLFGARHYSTGVDIWAVGCILAEMLLRVPFLPGDTDLNQLDKIFSVFGNPTDDIWPGVKLLPDYIQFKPYPMIPLQEIFTAAGDDLIEVLESMFSLYPLKRCTATEGLKMQYFSNRPAPTIGSKLPMPSSYQKQDDDEPRPSLKRKMFDLADSNLPGKKRLQF